MHILHSFYRWNQTTKWHDKYDRALPFHFLHTGLSAVIYVYISVQTKNTFVLNIFFVFDRKYISCFWITRAFTMNQYIQICRIHSWKWYTLSRERVFVWRTLVCILILNITPGRYIFVGIWLDKNYNTTHTYVQHLPPTKNKMKIMHHDFDDMATIRI